MVNLGSKVAAASALAVMAVSASVAPVIGSVEDGIAGGNTVIEGPARDYTGWGEVGYSDMASSVEESRYLSESPIARDSMHMLML